jgi:CheY-like chemotaxis protein
MNDDWTTQHKTRSLKPEPVLLADDAEENILSLYHAFKHADIPNPLFVVYDGQHVIDYLAGKPPFEDRPRYPLPCLVLLSTDLTRRSGLEVLQWIRLEAQGLKDLPIIMMADSVHKQELRQALQLGANDYIPKSFDFEEKIEWAKALKSGFLLSEAR